MELFEVAEEGSVGVRYVVGVLGLVYYLGCEPRDTKRNIVSPEGMCAGEVCGKRMHLPRTLP